MNGNLENSEKLNGSEKYYSRKYIHMHRWSTYSKLITCVLEENSSKILEVGFGNRLVSDILEKMGFFVKVLDNDKSLNPDYYMDVRDREILKLKNKFDLFIASQVLEHIKYSEFLEVIYNFSLIVKYLIITLPYTNLNSHLFSFNFSFPLIKGVRLGFKSVFKIFLKKPSYIPNKSHYWEIGIKNYSLHKIKKDIKRNGWIIKKNFINDNNPYHYFFILSSKNFME